MYKCIFICLNSIKKKSVGNPLFPRTVCTNLRKTLNLIIESKPLLHKHVTPQQRAKSYGIAIFFKSVLISTIFVFLFFLLTKKQEYGLKFWFSLNKISLVELIATVWSAVKEEQLTNFQQVPPFTAYKVTLLFSFF